MRLLILGLVPCLLWAGEARHKRFWLASVGAVLATAALDAHSTWGRPELNPVLRGASGRFDARSLSVKVGIVGGFLLAQVPWTRRNPSRQKSLSIVNWGMASATGVLATHNYLTRK